MQEKRLALFIGCHAADVTELELLLGILNWQTVSCTLASPDLVKSAALVFVDNVKIPLGLEDIRRNHSPLVVLIETFHNEYEDKSAKARGWRFLSIPLDLIAAEELIVSAS